MSSIQFNEVVGHKYSFQIINEAKDLNYSVSSIQEEFAKQVSCPQDYLAK